MAKKITPGPGKTTAGQCNDLFHLCVGVTSLEVASLLWFEANVKAVTEAYLL